MWRATRKKDVSTLLNAHQKCFVYILRREQRLIIYFRRVILDNKWSLPVQSLNVWFGAYNMHMRIPFLYYNFFFSVFKWKKSVMEQVYLN